MRGVADVQATNKPSREPAEMSPVTETAKTVDLGVIIHHGAFDYTLAKHKTKKARTAWSKCFVNTGTTADQALAQLAIYETEKATVAASAQLDTDIAAFTVSEELADLAFDAARLKRGTIVLVVKTDDAGNNTATLSLGSASSKSSKSSKTDANGLYPGATKKGNCAAASAIVEGVKLGDAKGLLDIDKIRKEAKETSGLSQLDIVFRDFSTSHAAEHLRSFGYPRG